jgi:hypothetical protein
MRTKAGITNIQPSFFEYQYQATQPANPHDRRFHSGGHRHVNHRNSDDLPYTDYCNNAGQSRDGAQRGCLTVP